MSLILRQCNRCDGTGTFKGQTCWRCRGDGRLDPMALMLPPDYYYSYQVYECLKKSEIDALSDADQRRLDRMLGCNMLYLPHGGSSDMLDDLLDLFEEGTNSRQNLDSLLGL